MSKYVPTALGIPTLITALCALFVEIAFHLNQTVELQLSGLVARALIVASFLVFTYYARQYRLFSFRKRVNRTAAA